jgi:hypothetical protein
LEIGKAKINVAGPLNLFTGAFWEFKEGWFQHDKYLGIICHMMNYFDCMTGKIKYLTCNLNLNLALIIGQVAEWHGDHDDMATIKGRLL